MHAIVNSGSIPTLFHRNTALMISTLVKSAFQTGYLSVESEGLIRQLLALKTCPKSDLNALETLYEALRKGQIQREARDSVQLPTLR